MAPTGRASSSSELTIQLDPQVTFQNVPIYDHVILIAEQAAIPLAAVDPN
jgi:hypothetical protein